MRNESWPFLSWKLSMGISGRLMLETASLLFSRLRPASEGFCSTVTPFWFTNWIVVVEHIVVEGQLGAGAQEQGGTLCGPAGYHSAS